MRSSWKPTGLVLLVALTGACDSTQPQQIDQQSFALRVLGVGAQMPSYYTYQFYEDLDNNSQQDPGEPLHLFCQSLPVGFPAISPQSVPWNFTIEVSVLRAGETEAVRLTSAAALDIGTNLTEYDTTIGTGSTPFKNPITIPGANPPLTNRVFRFLNPGRTLSAANAEVRAATTNPLFVISPATYGLGNGLCSEGNPGPATIDGGTIPFLFDLEKGDTVIVNLRRVGTRPAGFPAGLLGAQPQVRAILSLGGREVLVRGSTVTGIEPSAGISFSYTLI